MQSHTETEIDNFVTKKQLLLDLGIKSINTLKTYAGCYGINTTKVEFSQKEVDAIGHARHWINVQGMTVADYKAKFCLTGNDDRCQSADDSSEDLIGTIVSRFDNEQLDQMADLAAQRIAEAIDYKIMQKLPEKVLACVGNRFRRVIAAVPDVISLPSSDLQLAALMGRSA